MRARSKAAATQNMADTSGDTETATADARRDKVADANEYTVKVDSAAKEVRRNNANDARNTANKACGEGEAMDAVLEGSGAMMAGGATVSLEDCGEALCTKEERNRVDEATRMMKQRIAEYGAGKPRRTCEESIRFHSGSTDKSETHHQKLRARPNIGEQDLHRK